MSDLPFHLQHKSFIRLGDKKTGGPNLRLIRLENDKPSLTVTAYIFNKFVHPVENRYITPREAACLQDFPWDYAFKGALTEVHQQIGNAVPVKLAEAIASQVSEYFLKLGRCGIIKVASYFTGAGGFDLGFEQCSNNNIRFITTFSTDIAKYVEETIQYNRPHWNFIRRDVQDFHPMQVLASIGASPDVVIGGPPCQPFSVAGKQRSTNDPLGRLYLSYVSHIKQLSPEIVIMENVYGLAQVKSANMIKEIYDSFNEIGYDVTHRELLAADYGTPQKRRRLFFIAAKNLNLFSFPVPKYCNITNLLGLPQYAGAGHSFIGLPPPDVF